MVWDPVTRALDFADDSLTANTRCAYPLEAISNASATARGGQPRNIVMLTCDAFGVLPPIARLTPGAGDVPLPLRLHLQGRRHRARRDRAAAHLLHLLRRALHAAPARGLRRAPARPDRRAPAPPAGWSTPAGPAAPTAPARRMPIAATRALLDRRARRLAGRRRLPPRPDLRLRGPGRRPGRRRGACSTRAPPGPTPPPTTPRRRSSSRCSPTNFAQYVAHVADDVRAAAVTAA